MKKLLAIAVAVAFAAPAMADTNVYGKIHMSVGKVSGVAGTFVESHSSRLGFKGSNALDNGLTATHKLEMGYNFVDEEGSITPRDSWIGLKGGFGEVRVGRQSIPHSVLEYAIGHNSRYNPITKFSRVPNAIAYVNKMGPLGVAVAYVAAGEVEGGTASDSATNLMVNYKSGPIYAGISTLKATGASAATKIALGYKGGNYKVGYIGEKTIGTGDKLHIVNGNYNFGKTYVFAEYGKNSTAGTNQKNIEIGYNLGKGTKAYFEWENNQAGVKSNRIGYVHNF